MFCHQVSSSAFLKKKKKKTLVCFSPRTITIINLSAEAHEMVYESHHLSGSNIFKRLHVGLDQVIGAVTKDIWWWRHGEAFFLYSIKTSWSHADNLFFFLPPPPPQASSVTCSPSLYLHTWQVIKDMEPSRCPRPLSSGASGKLRCYKRPPVIRQSCLCAAAPRRSSARVSMTR